MALNMNTHTGRDTVERGHSAANTANNFNGECPLRSITRSVPVRHVKKSLFTIYMTVMMDVFSHSSWNGW